MKTYKFWIMRKRGNGYEKLNIDAADSGDAVNMLPACVTWDFRIND